MDNQTRSLMAALEVKEHFRKQFKYIDVCSERIALKLVMVHVDIEPRDTLVARVAQILNDKADHYIQLMEQSLQHTMEILDVPDPGVRPTRGDVFRHSHMFLVQTDPLLRVQMVLFDNTDLLDEMYPGMYKFSHA